MFSKQRNFKVICFAFDKTLKFESFTQWNGFSNAVDQQMMVLDYENDIRREEEVELCEARHLELELTKEMADELSFRLSELTKQLAGYRKCCCEQHHD